MSSENSLKYSEPVRQLLGKSTENSFRPLRTIYVLLTCAALADNRGYVCETYQRLSDILETCNISSAALNRVLSDLEDHGFLQKIAFVGARKSDRPRMGTQFGYKICQWELLKELQNRLPKLPLEDHALKNKIRDFALREQLGESA